MIRNWLARVRAWWKRNDVAAPVPSYDPVVLPETLMQRLKRQRAERAASQVEAKIEEKVGTEAALLDSPPKPKRAKRKSKAVSLAAEEKRSKTKET